MTDPTWPDVIVELCTGTPLQSPEFAAWSGDASVAWVDITTHVRHISIGRGRQRELDKFESGTADLVLDNQFRQFDPSWQNGPYATGYYWDGGTLLRPLCRIRIRAVTAEPMTYPLYEGFVNQWPVKYNGPHDSTVTIQCSDALTLLANIKLGDSLYEQEILRDHPYWFFKFGENGQDRAAVSAALTLAGSFAYRGSFFTTQSFGGSVLPHGNGLNSLAPAEGGGMAITGQPIGASGGGTQYNPWHPTDDQFECWVQVEATPEDGHFAVIFMFNDPVPGQCEIMLMDHEGYLLYGLINNNGSTSYMSKSSFKINDAKPHYIIASFYGGVYIDGTLNVTTGITFPSDYSPLTPFVIPTPGTFLATDGGSGSGPLVGFTGNIAAPAMYPAGSHLSLGRIVIHFAAGMYAGQDLRSSEQIQILLELIDWPTEMQEIARGDNRLQGMDWGSGASALSVLQTLMAAEGGAMYCTADGVVRFRNREAVNEVTRMVTSQADYGGSPGIMYANDGTSVAGLDHYAIYGSTGGRSWSSTSGHIHAAQSSGNQWMEAIIPSGQSVQSDVEIHSHLTGLNDWRDEYASDLENFRWGHIHNLVDPGGSNEICIVIGLMLYYAPTSGGAISSSLVALLVGAGVPGGFDTLPPLAQFSYTQVEMTDFTDTIGSTRTLRSYPWSLKTRVSGGIAYAKVWVDSEIEPPWNHRDNNVASTRNIIQYRQFSTQPLSGSVTGPSAGLHGIAVNNLPSGGSIDLDNILMSTLSPSQALTPYPFRDLSVNAPLDLIYNEITFSRQGGSSFTIKDVDSQGPYLRRGMDITNLPVQNDNVVRDMAQFYLRRYSLPRTRIETISFAPRSTPGLWNAILARELEDRVSVTYTPPGGGVTTLDTNIQRMEHDIDPKTKDWHVNMAMSPADDDTKNYLILSADSPLDARGKLDSFRTLAP